MNEIQYLNQRSALHKQMRELKDGYSANIRSMEHRRECDKMTLAAKYRREADNLHETYTLERERLLGQINALDSEWAMSKIEQRVGE